MLALTHLELARNEFLEGFFLGVIGFLGSGFCLYILLFRRKTFKRFLDWDARMDRRVGLPQWWTTKRNTFAESKTHVIYWSILTILTFLLMCFCFWGYLAASHRLNHSPSLETLSDNMKQWRNLTAGVGAGCTPEFIEMMQVRRSHKSGSARILGR
jgi:hypothetical protein